MSRPRPQVLIEHINKQTYKTEQVLASDGVWAVFYDSKPVNLKTSHMLTQYPGPKYKKTSFSNPGHAKNLAKKLNTQFKTDKFTVVLLTQGQQVYPDAAP
jgi:acetoin utilization deacetylase AcuC-like enzyme